MALSHVYSPYLGRYVLNLTSQVEPRVTVQRSLGVTPLAARGNIETYSFPSAAEVGVDKDWTAKVHNIGSTGKLGLGIVNPDGNPGSIVVTWQGTPHTINPGRYLRISTNGEVPNCTRLDTSGQIAFQAEGDYNLLLWGMHLRDSTWYYDEEKQIPATVTTPEAPWPVTKQYPYGITLKPGAFLEAVKTIDVGPVDTSVLLGATLDYKITYKSGTLRGIGTYIHWNEEKIAEHHFLVGDIGKTVQGTINLGTGRIAASNVLKVRMSQGPLGYNVARFDITLTLGYSEDPAEEPKPPPFEWPELEWWQWGMIGGFGLGVVYIVVKKPSMPAMPTIITVPYPVLRPKEGE